MIESIRCPNCGSIAERHHLSYLAQIKTQCEICDYLLVMCTRSGHVLESYAPGLPTPKAKPMSVRISPLSSSHNSNSRIRDIATLSI
ncbi:replication restart DNA helicase PriA [Pseudanabaena sp. FACHB-1998]|uniref:replication restart DNA helicase PriA n=1 Tax=Pseudanabaena sp. FACHB-1998 TaxID=2692858 RepID=UPI0016808393|nr:replication restart DNA helicase PriA [Pseudanabaena sp. FACHB-1998]MBD2177616.1 replication restart DNA helicase PriA [Pseudanabaena sp. FACHB-1998]